MCIVIIIQQSKKGCVCVREVDVGSNIYIYALSRAYDDNINI